MSDILLGMLTYKNSSITSRAISSIGLDVDRLFIDNGADADVKAVLPEPETTHLPTNIGVNPGWNIIMDRFLSGGWSWLIIASSDVTLAPNWVSAIRRKMHLEKPVFMPHLIDDIRKLSTKGDDVVVEAHSATPGFFFCMPREAVEIVYPIPEQIKIWFGDEWIFTRLRRRGWHTLILGDLIAHHAWSSNITSNCRRLIELDKVAWEEVKELL